MQRKTAGAGAESNELTGVATVRLANGRIQKEFRPVRRNVRVTLCH